MAELLKLLPNGDFFQRFQPDRVEVNVAGNRGKIGLLLDENALVSPLVKMPYPLVLPIEKSGIRDIEVAHEFGKIAEGGFHEQMEMVRHQDIGMEFDRIDFQRMVEKPQKRPAIIIAPENLPSLIPEAHHANTRCPNIGYVAVWQ